MSAAESSTTATLGKRKSILDSPKVVEEGDQVVMYTGVEAMSSIVVKRGEVVQNKYGKFAHSSMIGRRYGEKMVGEAVGKTRAGFVYILRATPELWTKTLGRRTQIIYSRDISTITFYLELRPGSIVVESGTGSGSFSTSLARTIAPTGHLFTYEFHADRAQQARDDFERMGLTPLITVHHCDVIANGFSRPPNSVDAVFLDLPQPHLAIGHAADCLKPYVGRLCSYSPCIEQSQATCDALRNCKFTDIHTVECLLQPFSTHHEDFEKIDESNLNIPKRLVLERTTQSTSSSRLVSQEANIRGHTAYLTFASAPSTVVASTSKSTTTTTASSTSTTTTNTSATNTISTNSSALNPDAMN